MIGLMIIFGIILLIDKTMENSPKKKREIEQAEINAKIRFEQEMQRINQYVNRRIKMWEDSGLPPSMWR